MVTSGFSKCFQFTARAHLLVSVCKNIKIISATFLLSEVSGQQSWSDEEVNGLSIISFSTFPIYDDRIANRKVYK